MTQPTTPQEQPRVEPVDLPLEEQWNADNEREFDEMLDRLYAGGYFDSHRDQDFWL